MRGAARAAVGAPSNGFLNPELAPSCIVRLPCKGRITTWYAAAILSHTMHHSITSAFVITAAAHINRRCLPALPHTLHATARCLRWVTLVVNGAGAVVGRVPVLLTLSQLPQPPI
jgi:hypothetical protein